MLRWFRPLLPKISESEKIALRCGGLSLDRNLFENNVISRLKNYSCKLSEKETQFLKKEVPELCRIGHPFDVYKNKRLSENQMTMIKEEGFLGLCVPEHYGGKGFSSYGHSRVVQMLSSRCVSSAVTVMVPNSLGPSELLLKYGTEDQKKKYLSKLATGKMVPCFGLTGPHNGSDALGNLDKGRLIGPDTIEFSCQKRWITLAPIADLIGLAIDVEGHGPTLLLLERDERVLSIGQRHYPVGAGFLNGPIVTKHPVRISTDCIIGGPVNLGKGWEMLMECLTEGRGISLPALSSGMNCFLALQTTYYAKARTQFKMSLSDMEGVQEKLSSIFANTYCCLALHELYNATLLKGEKSGVLSAILKYRATEWGRETVNMGMDIFAGKGITTGYSNPIAHFYSQVPIAITVEGSNTLTRSLIIFAQGVNKSHPLVGDLVKALEEGNETAFRHLFLKMVSYVSRHTVTALTGKMNWLSKDLSSILEHRNAIFILLSTWMLLKGKALKKKQAQTGRMADLMTDLLTGYSLLWFNRHPKVETILLQKTLARIDRTIHKILQEENNGFLSLICRPFRPVQGPNDLEWLGLSHEILNNRELDEMLASYIYLAPDDPIAVFRNYSRGGLKMPEEILEDIIRVESFTDRNLTKRRKEPLIVS